MLQRLHLLAALTVRDNVLAPREQAPTLVLATHDREIVALADADLDLRAGAIVTAG
ncbi:hypothetical protein [Nocardioides sp. T2.26MG-1]|uniref:hypothetical protein n=1 Tax=Nocardioides sp. T2.26MG-1 TaxID=3041166 RepID=UPI002540995D|nr:hypothetical protein [Nocardioides sp. T2.26MG-1]